jgi:hypothetical protein
VLVIATSARLANVALVVEHEFSAIQDGPKCVLQADLVISNVANHFCQGIRFSLGGLPRQATNVDLFDDLWNCKPLIDPRIDQLALLNFALSCVAVKQLKRLG